MIRIGAGESGKSTVLKQMKLIYASGFSKAEREDCRSIIFSNLVHAFKVILEAMDEFDIALENPQNQVRGLTLGSAMVANTGVAILGAGVPLFLADRVPAAIRTTDQSGSGDWS